MHSNRQPALVEHVARSSGQFFFLQLAGTVLFLLIKAKEKIENTRKKKKNESSEEKSKGKSNDITFPEIFRDNPYEFYMTRKFYEGFTR